MISNEWWVMTMKKLTLVKWEKFIDSSVNFHSRIYILYNLGRFHLLNKNWARICKCRQRVHTKNSAVFLKNFWDWWTLTVKHDIGQVRSPRTAILKFNFRIFKTLRLFKALRINHYTQTWHTDIWIPRQERLYLFSAVFWIR